MPKKSSISLLLIKSMTNQIHNVLVFDAWAWVAIQYLAIYRVIDSIVSFYESWTKLEVRFKYKIMLWLQLGMTPGQN